MKIEIHSKVEILIIIRINLCALRLKSLPLVPQTYGLIVEDFNIDGKILKA